MSEVGWGPHPRPAFTHTPQKYNAMCVGEASAPHTPEQDGLKASEKSAFGRQRRWSVIIGWLMLSFFSSCAEMQSFTEQAAVQEPCDRQHATMNAQQGSARKA